MRATKTDIDDDERRERARKSSDDNSPSRDVTKDYGGDWEVLIHNAERRRRRARSEGERAIDSQRVLECD